MAENKFLGGLFGGKNKASNQEQKQGMTEIERIDRQIMDMEESEQEQYASGKQPWEFDLSAITTSFRKKREEKQKFEEEQYNQYQQNISNAPGYQEPVKKPFDISGSMAEEKLGKIDTSYQTEKSSDTYVSGQPFDINSKEVPLHLRSAGKTGKQTTILSTGDPMIRRDMVVNRFDDRGKPIKILKNDDWIKKQPWASYDPEADVYYTTKLEGLPKGVYELDQFREFPNSPKDNTTFLAGNGFGVDPATVKDTNINDLDKIGTIEP